MKSTVFVDGDFLVKDDIFIEAMTPGVLEARGVFETMRVEEGHVCFLDTHLARLRKGLRVLNIRMPHTAKELHAIIHKVLVFNQLKNARLRVMAYQRNRSFELTVIALPRRLYTAQDYTAGYSVTITPCVSRLAKYCCVKSLDYSRYREAYLSALQKGFDETLLVNAKDCVFEASRSNLFFIKDNILYTPSLTQGCLEGITRQLVVECARERNVMVRNTKPSVKDILGSDEVFLTNALIGIMPVTKVDGKTMQLGRIGDLTYQLRSQYLKKLLPPTHNLTSATACV